jgi:mannose-6-phosphate isomerase-like protein (cupin superfamily)
MLEKVNLEEKFAQIDESWSPRIAGDVNDTAIKLVKFDGEFIWHHHDREDELFFVVRGKLTMKLRDGDVEVCPGEFLIVPRGTEHMPVADEEAWVMLVEPRSTLNTGNVSNERTIPHLKRV